MTPPHPDLETIVRAALEAHRDGRFADADQLCREVLASAPNHPDALHLRGVIASDSGELKAAIELLRLAVAVSPRRAQTHNSLGVALRRNGDLTEAIAEFRCAIELKPDYAEAFNNLGNALQLSGKAAEAVACYRQALSVRPNDVDVRVNLSEALRRLDAIDEAEVVLREATDVDPLAAYPWYFLCRIARDRRQTSEAIARFRRYLERDPADEYGARLDLAALGAEAPAPAGASYIRSFCAERANTWDTTPDNPHYLGHDLILDVLREELRRHRDPAILDAGCGTGVLGERLRPYTRNLDGVDLSPHMVAKARERRVYDRLACADLVDFLRENLDRYDLIVCAAVLIHNDTLIAPLAAAHQALRSDGAVAMTLFQSARDDVEALPFKCYAHGAGYLRTCAEEVGFVTESLSESVHEYHQGEPVPALTALFRRPKSDVA